MELSERIKTAQRNLGELDALIVNGNSNNYYLSGVIDEALPNTFYSVILKNKFYFVATSFHLKQINQKISNGAIRLADKSTGFGSVISALVTDCHKIGFESQQFTYAKYAAFKKILKGKKLIPCDYTIERQREIKDAGEISLIKKSAEITDMAFKTAIDAIKPEITENTIKQIILQSMRCYGADGPAFEPVVASGRNGADPHCEGSNKKIKKGELIIIDIGARYKHYRSDMTRTIFTGKVTKKYRDLYNIVLETQQKALDECVIGASPKTIYENCVANFAKYNQNRYFTHGLGHGVGIDIHEAPSLSAAGTGTLQNGMVFTVEPGLYHLGWGGIRIEDLCVMRNNKLEILSKTPKDLIEIDC